MAKHSEKESVLFDTKPLLVSKTLLLILNNTAHRLSNARALPPPAILLIYPLPPLHSFSLHRHRIPRLVLELRTVSADRNIVKMTRHECCCIDKKKTLAQRDQRNF